MDTKFLREAVRNKMGAHGIFVAATFDWFDRLGFKTVKISDDHSVIYLDVPEIPTFDNDKERDRLQNSVNVLKLVKRKFAEAGIGDKIKFKYRIVSDGGNTDESS